MRSRDGQIGLIDLDQPFQALPVWPHHGTAKAVQHGPGRLIAAQPQDSLQAEGADSLLLAGEIPRTGEPDLQGRAGLVKDGARGDGGLTATVFAHQPDTAAAVRRGHGAAARAGETVRPAQAFEVGQARLLGGKPVKEFTPGARIVLSGDGHNSWLFIQYIQLHWS